MTNPYSPPTAAVADVIVEIDRSIRPRTVTVALWVGVALLAVSVVIEAQATIAFAKWSDQLVFGFALARLIGRPLLFGWLLFKIWRGRNWARITYACIMVAGLVLTAIGMAAMQQAIPAKGMLAFDTRQLLVTGASWAAQLTVVVLLLTPSSRRWFLNR